MDAMREGSSDGPVLMPESMLHACVLGDADAALLAHGHALAATLLGRRFLDATAQVEQQRLEAVLLRLLGRRDCGR